MLGLGGGGGRGRALAEVLGGVGAMVVVVATAVAAMRTFGALTAPRANGLGPIHHGHGGGGGGLRLVDDGLAAPSSPLISCKKSMPNAIRTLRSERCLASFSWTVTSISAPL